LAVVSAGCQVMLEDFAIPHAKYSQPAMADLQIGMAKADVLAKLGAPDALAGSKQTEKGLEETIEYWQYSATFSRDEATTKYRVYFMNGRMTGWDSRDSQ
jgi:hypothetical protein